MPSILLSTLRLLVFKTLSGPAGRCSLVALIGIRQMVHTLSYFFRGLHFDQASSSFVETLREYFSQFGKVDACTIMRDAAGRSRCFAFLTFEDPASVNAVMVREHVLDGKIVSVLRNLVAQHMLIVDSD